jgi:hypothetical protein
MSHALIDFGLIATCCVYSISPRSFTFSFEVLPFPLVVSIHYLTQSNSNQVLSRLNRLDTWKTLQTARLVLTLNIALLSPNFQFFLP